MEIDRWRTPGRWLDQFNRTGEKEEPNFDFVETYRDEMAMLPYTSGTTRNPKAVVHIHNWFYAHLQVAPKVWLELKEGDLA